MAVRKDELRKIYRFDEFLVDPRKRLLLRDGKPVTLNSKAFDLLLALVTSDGRELSKDELMQMVWQGQIVEENNLAVHIYSLRKILGERKAEHRYIITIPGVGYRFVAEVSETTSNPEGLFIESHTVSRIVVEEGSGQSNYTGAIADVYGEVAKLEASTTTAIAPIPSHNSKPVRLAVLSVGILLAVALSGFFLYRNRSRDSVDSARSASGQQMTMTRMTNGGQLGASSVSPDGNFIAYIQNSSAKNGTLFVQQADTNTVLQLLEPGDRKFGCTNFSPDGSLIYYVVFDARDPYGALYSVPVLGGMPKRILANVGECFSLSPDGKRVAFYRDDAENKRMHLAIAEPGGNEQWLLTRPYNELKFGFSTAWSPDGSSIAFTGDSEPDDVVTSLTMFGVDVNSGGTKSLTTERFSGVGKMSWTGDGRNLVFVAKRPRDEANLFLLDYSSGEVRHITNELQSYGNFGLGITADSSAIVADVWERKEEIWSVDANGNASKAVRVKSGTTNGRLGITALPGGRIAYIARTGNNLDIWTVKEDGTEAKALTADSFSQRHVVASPDGRYLVFTSDSAGSSHIFRMNADDGSDVVQLTFGETIDRYPNVSADGQWVAYASSDGKQTTVWKAPLAGGDAVQLTDYESSWPVFAPDGKTIACVLQTDSRAKLASIAIVPADGGKPIKSFQVIPFQHSHYPIHWTPDGKAIAFGNWRNGVFDLWRQPLSGGAPQQLTSFPSGSVWNFAYSRDGKRIFLCRGTTFVDVVLIKNFR
jgi:Tol biopolymer transport system component/DNA-binding winged helix-turn-helix (wHTH) protein